MDNATLLGLAIELGIGAGYGQTYAPAHYSNIDIQKTDKSDTLQAYLSARGKYFGGEIGYLKLPEVHSKAYTSDYPAYKGLPAGTYPQTAAATQDITASAPYARVNLYGPEVFGIEPYGFYGRAKVKSKNHEHAIYNGTDEADFRQELTRKAPYYGIGAKGPIDKQWNWRAEYGRIPHATVDYHTLDRNVQMFNLGIGRQF